MKLSLMKNLNYCRDLCNELMAFQKSKSSIKAELFDNMNFDPRMIPSIKSAIYNYTVVVKDDDKIVGYVYSNIYRRKGFSVSHHILNGFITVLRNNEQFEKKIDV
jgi:hypothetical protein